eukprot:3039221-Prymnesium_polylepis.2
MCYIDAGANNFDPQLISRLAHSTFRLHDGDVLSNIVVWPSREQHTPLLNSFSTGEELRRGQVRRGSAILGDGEHVESVLMTLVTFVRAQLLTQARYAILLIDLRGVSPIGHPSGRLTNELRLIARDHGVACVVLHAAPEAGQGPLIGGTVAGMVVEPDDALDAGSTVACIRRPMPLRWEAVRRAVRARAVANFWLEWSSERACAPGGAGRKRDFEEFAADFDAILDRPPTPPSPSSPCTSGAQEPDREAPRTEEPPPPEEKASRPSKPKARSSTRSKPRPSTTNPRRSKRLAA